MPLTLGASHYTTETWELQRTNNFEIQIAGLDRIVGAGSANLLTLAVQSAQLPSEQSNDVQVHYGNMLVHVAGTTTYGGTNQIVVNDAIQEDIENIIVQWRKTVYDPETDQVGLAYNYKMDARLIQYAPDGSRERVWKLQGVFPMGVEYGSLDYTSQGAVKQISMTLSYDKAVRI